MRPTLYPTLSHSLHRLPTFLTALAALVTVLLTFAAGQAHAAGSFTIKTPTVEEKGGEWHVKVRIDLARPPPMMHTPMRFTFSKQAVDERAIMAKGAEPEHHRVVLETAAKQIVSLDVDFADAGGKVFKSTYFEFDLARKDGYFEAGEYLATLSGADGDVGTAQKLTLKGDNPTVYRGAMDFTGDGKSQKKKGPRIESISNGLDAGVAANGADDPSTSSAGPASTDVVASGTAPSMVPTGAYNRTEEEESVKDRPKGCGCIVAGLNARAGSGMASFVALGLGLAVARRTRRLRRATRAPRETRREIGR